MNTEAIKEIVLRFNKEVIEDGNIESFNHLMHPDFVNHSAPIGKHGAAGMIYTFNQILRPAISEMKVTIHQQIAEDNFVTTRKTISGIFSGELLGVPPTYKEISINVIDIVHIKEGKYFEHWGLNTLESIINVLKNQNT
jgi:predicted ester cyclase